jgi:hypothetical protein
VIIKPGFREGRGQVGFIFSIAIEPEATAAEIEGARYFIPK